MLYLLIYRALVLKLPNDLISLLSLKTSTAHDPATTKPYLTPTHTLMLAERGLFIVHSLNGPSWPLGDLGDRS